VSEYKVGEFARGCKFVAVYGGDYVPSQEPGDQGDYDGPVFFFTREDAQVLAESVRLSGSAALADALLALAPLVETAAEGPGDERGWYVNPADGNFGRDNVWTMLEWFTYDELAASMLLEDLARQIGFQTWYSKPKAKETVKKMAHDKYWNRK
jgi:hypothetical protein